MMKSTEDIWILWNNCTCTPQNCWMANIGRISERHVKELIVGMLVILLRNINLPHGLCNGTRLIVNHLDQYIIQVIILTRKNGGMKVTIPRLVLHSCETQWPFALKRRQFFVHVFYSITIIKVGDGHWCTREFTFQNWYSVMDNFMFQHHKWLRQRVWSFSLNMMMNNMEDK